MSEAIARKPNVPAHLLMTAFITNRGLSNYNLGKIPVEDFTFRPGRLLTSLSTMSQLNWKSARFFLEFDEELQEYEPVIQRFLQENFSKPQIETRRLQFPREWREALAKIPSGDLLLLNSNDDHAIVPQGIEALRDLTFEMERRPEVRIGMVTHLPEFVGYKARERIKDFVKGSSNRSNREFEIDYSIGTILVRGDLAKQWFTEGGLPEDGRIVRPDNPFGPSVTFLPSLALLPRHEIFRHLDGYSHVDLFREVAPLRNSKVITESESEITDLPWRMARWPSDLMAYKGRGGDVYGTLGDRGFLDSISATVARLKLHWGLRIGFYNWNEVRLWPAKVSVLSFTIGTLTFLLTPTGLRNLADKLIFDIPTIGILKIVTLFRPRYSKILSQVWYLGTSRTIALNLRWKARARG